MVPAVDVLHKVSDTSTVTVLVVVPVNTALMITSVNTAYRTNCTGSWIAADGHNLRPQESKYLT